ncbi:MAG: tRNA (adenine-N1)-methyltransferase [Methanomassiliicoccales archaeon]|nr:MAG: tRNA (adenine-N1)-methyltransferase [Methanomassiliicoccales archaeon]
MMSKTIRENDSVVLMDGKGNRILLTVESGIKKVKDLGVYDPGDLIGANYYQQITIGNKKFMIMAPSISDKITAIERKAQIILPKDGMFIIFYCDIKSGDKVIEGGAGSGALTILLANSVRPKGKIISYEKRDEFIKIAKKNLIRAGLNEHVNIVKKDVTENIKEKNVDAVILDIPNPWDAIDNAFCALKSGGHVASYSPTVNQVEKTVKKMRECGFSGIKTLETLQREMVVGERGVRPSFNVLGHTGYVSFARKVS